MANPKVQGSYNGPVPANLRLCRSRAPFPNRRTAIWGRSVGGRNFVHILDDLKDHHADRRAGLDYMLEPLENIGLEAWDNGLAQFIRTFAKSRGLEVPARNH